MGNVQFVKRFVSISTQLIMINYEFPQSALTSLWQNEHFSSYSVSLGNCHVQRTSHTTAMLYKYILMYLIIYILR